MSGLSSGEALLTEHLRYTPLSLIDDIINTINAIVYRALTAIETGLLSSPPAALGFDQRSVPAEGGAPISDSDDPEERQRVEIEEGVHRLETLLEATVDKDFDLFEIYTLRNILKVPEDLEPYMRLRHYEGLELPPSPSRPTAESITELRRQLQASQQLNLVLSHTHASNAQLLEQLKSTLDSASGQLSFLNSSKLASASNPLTASAQFTKSQLPALKELLDNIRPRVPVVAALAEHGAKAGLKGDQRDARVRYVEGVVERVIESQLGATREGDQELGPRRTEDEVAQMERMAAEGAKGATGSENDDRMDE